MSNIAASNCFDKLCISNLFVGGFLDDCARGRVDRAAYFDLIDLNVAGERDLFPSICKNGGHASMCGRSCSPSGQVVLGYAKDSRNSRERQRLWVVIAFFPIPDSGGV